MRTSARRSSPAPADIVTYRLNDKMIYVPPAANFEQAVTFARSAFESDLNGVDKSRISFSLNVLANGKQRAVGISSAAWPAVGSHLARYEIIDVHVLPEIKVSPPPSYRSHSPEAEKKLHISPQSSPQASSQSSRPSSSSNLSSLDPRRLFQRLP